MTVIDWLGLALAFAALSYGIRVIGDPTLDVWREGNDRR